VIEYVYTIAILAGINVILASGFNLILGYGGLVSVAHPIFYAIGGYVSALLAQKLGTPIAASIIIGALISAATSVCVSLGRLSGHRKPRIPARLAAHHQQRRDYRRGKWPDQHSIHRGRPAQERALLHRGLDRSPGVGRRDPLACIR
jgi:hypothetical protein